MTITTETFAQVYPGASANDGTGDSLRAAFIKVNSNFSNISDVGFDAANIYVSGAIVAEVGASVIPFYYANTNAFPSATTYHGAIAHSHADGKMYFAHSAAWRELANEAPYYQIFKPTANVAVTANVGQSRVLLAPTGTIVSFGANVALPNATVDGTLVSISSNVAVVQLAVYGQWLSSVDPGVNITLAAGSSVNYLYSSADVKWYKIG